MTAEAVPKLNLIAAMCKNRGIGYKNSLPWDLKKEMAYFTEMSSKTKNSGTPEEGRWIQRLKRCASKCHNKDEGNSLKILFFKSYSLNKMNAVIMGRRTFESIPNKSFPLYNRINIILSKTLSCAPPGCFLAQNLEQAIDMTQNGHLKDKTENIFIIGGASVYKESLESRYPCLIYLTKIQADIKCDIFFPEFSEEKFPEVFGLPDVPNEEQEEDGVKWTYHAYEKKI